jgi:hypothetical protein
MKKSILVLSSVALLALAGCGGEGSTSSSEASAYHVETSAAFVGNNTVTFGSDFNETQFEIEDANSVKVSSVTKAMVAGFDSKQAKFGKDLTATVTYQGQKLPLTYQISSSYTIDNAYSVILHDDETIRLDYVSDFSSKSTYTIPENLEALPSPLNTWPVTDFNQSLDYPTLTTLTLNKSLSVLSSTMKSVLEIVPADGGKIAYQDGLLMANTGTYDRTLLGVQSSYSTVTMSLPEGVKSIESCALSHAISSVTSLVLPVSLSSMSTDIFLNWTNLPNLASVSLAGSSTSFKVDESGVLYSVLGTNSKAILAPFANPIGTEAAPYAITGTASTVNLNFIYGHTNIAAISLPAIAKQISLAKAITGLKVMVLPQTDELITISASNIAKLPSDLIVKVPAGKLDLYKAADNWKTIADRIVANA